MATEKLSSRQIYCMMGALLLGSFITTLAETLMNNGIPMIMKETHVSEMDAQWLNTGYMLVSGMLMPLADYVLRRFSLRWLFTTTMSIFLLGTLIATFAPNYGFLLIGRLIEALAVGINMPLVTSVLTVIIPPQHRGLAIGIAGIVINLGPAIGPTLSGIILEYYSWRMLFIILLPLSILTIILTQFFVHNVIQPRQLAIDIWSVILAMLGLGFFLYGITKFSVTNANLFLASSITLVGMISLWLFIRRQLRIDHPLLDLRVFTSPRYRLGLIITLLASGAIMSPELMLPLFSQNILKVSPIISGLVMMPSALAMSIISPLAGRLYDEFGIKKVGIISSWIALVMALPMIFYHPFTSVLLVTIVYALRSGALMLCYTPANVYALNALSQSSVVAGNTIIVTLVQVANSFAVAFAVITQNFAISYNLHRGIAMTIAQVHGYQWAFGSMILLIIIMCCLMFKLRND